MPLVKIVDNWRKTGIPCIFCGEMTYQYLKYEPQCGTCYAVQPKSKPLETQASKNTDKEKE